MTDESLLRRLLHRRVPQILGLYIAGTWMAIEIGDWMVERFGLTPALTSYIFVALVAMLPSVAILAYFHGAPGKDEWSRTEKVALPLNVLAAVAALMLFVRGTPAVEATEVMVVMDERGEEQTYVVAKAGHHQRVIAFFWDNETGDLSLDWLSYGLPFMLAEDLGRSSPLVSVLTPFRSLSLRDELEQGGFGRGRGEPLAMQRQIARDRLAQAFVTGRLFERDGGPAIEAELVDVASGRRLARYEAGGEDWFDVVDALTVEFRAGLGLSPSLDEGTADLPVEEYLTASVPALRDFVAANVAAVFDNDYPRAIAALEKAIEKDPSFADALAQLSLLHYLNGDTAAALAAIERAQAYEYKLSTRTRFILRGNEYALKGDVPTAIRVLETWAEVEPNNPVPLEEVGRLYPYLGDAESREKSLAAYEKALELNPAAYDILLKQALVQRLDGRSDAALASVRRYLDHRPDDRDGYLLLARIQTEAGELGEARTAYEKASYLGSSSIEPELGLAKLDLRTGDFEGAAARIERLRDRPLSNDQRVALLAVDMQIAYTRGRLRRGLEVLDRAEEVTASYLPPLVVVLQYSLQRAQWLAELGEFERAEAALKEARDSTNPPWDGYLRFGELIINGLRDDKEAYDRTLAAVEAFHERYPNPLFAPFVLGSKAAQACWEDEDERGIELAQRALELLDGSVINAESEVGENPMLLVVIDALIDAGAYELAAERLELVLRGFPAHAQARMRLGLVESRRGDPEAARAQLERALAIWEDADEHYVDYRRALALVEDLEAEKQVRHQPAG